MKNKIIVFLLVVFAAFSFPVVYGEEASKSFLRLSLQQRLPSNWEKDAWIITNRIEEWKASETAILVHDMRNEHPNESKTARIAELALALNPVLDAARKKGVRIVHSAGFIRNEIPKTGAKQYDALVIRDEDSICDSDEEIEIYFKEKDIKNVILIGAVPLSKISAMLRMVKKVVLMRDMIDGMSISIKAPDLNYFSALDLIVDYIETNYCPSIVSTDFTGKKQFKFSADKRKRIAILTAEGEYHANQKLPEFANELTFKNYHCDFALGVPRMEGKGIAGRHNLENLQILEDADLAILFVRRRALEPEKMAQIKNYIASGRPVLGIRTSSVAFDAKGNVPREGGKIVAATEKTSKYLAQWPELDRDVWGGNYRGHYAHLKTGTDITLVPGMENHPILKGVTPFNSLNWLYQCAPLRSEKAQVLLLGSNPGKPLEPVLWTNGRNVVYTSLGHWDDWKIESFQNLMFNTVNYLLNP